MSDQPPRDDEPTRAYQPFGEDAGEPTRIEGQVVPPYDPNKPEGFAPGEREAEPEQSSRKEWIAPAFTIALLAVIFGIGIGWLLFNGIGSDDDDSGTTTTSSTLITTTTSTSAVPAAGASTSSTTTSTTSTTAAVRSSSTVRATTTTARPPATAATTTTAPNQTVGTQP